jgi:isomerase DpgB
MGADTMDIRANGTGRVEAGQIAVRLSGSQGLADLTAELKAVCDAVEDSGETTTLSLWLDGLSHAEGWPQAGDLPQINRWERTLRRLERLPAVCVVVIDGICGGPSLDLLLTSDYRIATVGFRLLPQSLGGQLWPGMALHRLANQVGAVHTRRMLVRSEELTAHDALRTGLVDEVTDDARGRVEALTVLRSRLSGTEFAIRRGLLRDAPATRFDDALGSHLAACDREIRRLYQQQDAEGEN